MGGLFGIRQERFNVLDGVLDDRQGDLITDLLGRCDMYGCEDILYLNIDKHEHIIDTVRLR